MKKMYKVASVGLVSMALVAMERPLSEEHKKNTAEVFSVALLKVDQMDDKDKRKSERFSSPIEAKRLPPLAPEMAERIKKAKIWD